MQHYCTLTLIECSFFICRGHTTPDQCNNSTFKIVSGSLVRLLTTNFDRPIRCAAHADTAKKLQHIMRSNELYWIGNGFPVPSLFSYPHLEVTISSFLLFDYADPLEFPPTTKRLGVDEHPHRGFEI